MQRVLEQALDELVGRDGHSGVQVSSRTDAGVHALRNVFHVDVVRAGRPLEPQELRGGLNHYLRKCASSPPSEVVVVDAEVAPSDFHARFSATGRRYLYRIACAARDPPVFERRRAWCVPEDDLDAAAMNQAGDLLSRRSLDWTSFRGKDCVANSPVKVVDLVRVSRLESAPERGHLLAEGHPLILIEVNAKSFLHHQGSR